MHSTDLHPKAHNACIVCGSTSLKRLPSYYKDHLVKCTGCSFVFCSRIPSQKELSAHYATYRRGGDISPITIRRYHELLDSFEPFRRTNRLLDIGCGDGYFLATAKERGWIVYGTEFTEEAVEVCRQKAINMYQGPLDSAHYEPDAFDVVTSFEVIEHINDPLAKVGHVAAILRKGGLFYVTTPNFNSVSRALLGPRWNMITYPEHLSYYTPRTMRRLMENNGFRTRKIVTTGISLQRFASSRAGGSKASPVNRDEQLREKTETRLHYRAAKQAINFLLRLTRSGDALKGFFICK